MDEEVIRRAAKPGHQSREAIDRASFTAQLIRAIEAAQQEAERRESDQGDLAEAAFQKLQFDFPLVSAAELAALVDSHRSGAGFPLRPKYLAVVREGATVADASPEERAASQTEAGSSSDDEAAAAAAAAGPASNSPLLPLFQQLYAVILVRALQRALGPWGPAECASFLGPLLPCLPDERPAEATPVNDELLGNGALPAAEGGGPVLQDTPAAQEDSDDVAYESLEPAGAQPGGPGGAPPAAAAGAGGWQQERHLLPALRYLGDLLSWHFLSEDSVWRELKLMQELAACVRAARQHPAFAELAPGVAEPLLRLAMARMAACPADIGSFGTLLDALGLAEAGALHPEAARLALSAAATLAPQLATQQAQRKLWQEVHASLLPVAAAELEALQTGLAKRARQAAAAAAPTEAELWRLAGPCQLLYYYVLLAPPALPPARLAEVLLGGGLFRELVLLIVRLALLPEAEPLRCTLLLCCAACPSLLDWAAAVPGFKAAALALPQQQPQRQETAEEQGVLGAGSRLAVHGALWQLLLEPEPQAAEPLAALLRGAADSPEQVECTLGLLQLMWAVHQVARGRYLWGGAPEAALHALGETLRQQSRQVTLGAEAGAGVPQQPGSGDPQQGEPQGEESAEEEREAAKLAQSAGQQAALLAARRAAQLQPACHKLVKELLQRGGGAAAGKHE